MLKQQNATSMPIQKHISGLDQPVVELNRFLNNLKLKFTASYTINIDDINAMTCKILLKNNFLKLKNELSQKYIEI